MWSSEKLNLKLLGGKVLSGERKGWTVGRNMDWSVNFLDLGPGGGCNVRKRRVGGAERRCQVLGA